MDDAVPDLVRCPRDGPHRRRGRARRGRGGARGGPGGHQQPRVVCVQPCWLENRPKQASWPQTGRSPTARTRRPSADSRSSMCPRARRRCSGLPRSPSPAAARKRSGRSGPTPNSTRCSARLIAGGDVPAAPDRRRPAALEQDLPWRRSDNAGLRIDLSRGRGATRRTIRLAPCRVQLESADGRLPAGDAWSGGTPRMAIQRVVPGQALGRVPEPDRDRASRTSGPGAPSVDFSLIEDEDRDAGGRSSRRRRTQEASRCEG